MLHLNHYRYPATAVIRVAPSTQSRARYTKVQDFVCLSDTFGADVKSDL